MTATSATASVTLRTQRALGLNAIFIGPAVLVESQTNPGTWYVCESGTCTCPAYIYRGCCKHLKVAAWVDEMDRESARPVEHDWDVARYHATGEWPSIWGRRS